MCIVCTANVGDTAWSHFLSVTPVTPNLVLNFYAVLIGLGRGEQSDWWCGSTQSAV